MAHDVSGSLSSFADGVEGGEHRGRFYMMLRANRVTPRARGSKVVPGSEKEYPGTALKIGTRLGSYEITAPDLTGALEQQGTEIRPGDVVLIHTGWGSLWMRDNERFVQTQPGIGLEAGQYLVDRQIVMAGSDNWGIEVVPNPDDSLAFPVHQLFILKNGIYNLENLATEELAADGVYEFAFIFTPLRLKGATGSPGNPIAIR